MLTHHFPLSFAIHAQGSKNSSSYGGKAKAPAKGAKNPSAPIVKPSAAAKKSTYDDDDYGYGDSDKPEMLEGWVEKKGGGRVKMGSDWQRRYFLLFCSFYRCFVVVFLAKVFLL